MVDFNARTGTLTDFVSMETGINDFDLSLINCELFDSINKCKFLGINIDRVNCELTWEYIRWIWSRINLGRVR